jgi:hypothetical protein
MDLTQQQLLYIINHVFLPLKLPEEYDVNSPANDATLLRYTAWVAKSFYESLERSQGKATPSALSSWSIVSKMLQNTAQLHQHRYLVNKDLEAAFREMETDG